MPLFEVYNSMMKEKARAATQAKNMATSPEPFSTPEDEFGELIWDNGPRKKMMIQEMKDNAAAVVTKLATAVGGAFPLEDRELFLAGRRSARFGLSAQGDDDDAAEDDTVPWITYNPAEEEDLPREIPPEEDYCAEFLNEFDLNCRTLPPPADGRGSSGLAQVVRHFGLSDHGRTAKEGGAAGNLGGDESGAGKVIRICGRTQDLSQRHDRLNAEERRRQQQQERRVNHVVDGGLHGGISRTSPCKAPSSRASPSRGGGLINFSHFLRPVALAKASLEGNRAAGGKLASGHESTSGSRPLESTLVNSGSAFKCISATPPLTVDAKPASKPPRQESIMVNGGQRADTNSKKKLDDAGDADRDMPSSSFAGSAALSRHEGRRRSETADEASASSSSSSSSSSSGSSHGEASNNCKRRGKRKKHCEQDDEEEEEESGNFRADAKGFVGNAKHARDRGTKKRVYQRSAGTKRRRASEVHNLSERRRRDRINDRMKALQELIPNCNKQVDKASMLEEAIEYLKSLQFQLQMMSMGSGAFCMPQTVARCVQNFVMPTMTPPFAAMGMGLGFGMGMGMYNMSGSGSSNPMFPVPPVHLRQLAGANNSLAAAQAVLRGAAPPAAVNPQMFGAAGQGGPVLMPRLPLSSLLALPTKANMAAGAPCRTSAPLQPGADPLTPAVNSEGKGGRNLHGKAAQGPS